MKLIIGNWKMNPPGLNEAVALASKISFSIKSESFDRMVMLPPFIFIEEMVKRFKQINWGAQDFFWESRGSFTGEVSLPMLKDIGVNWVLVGHSERRIIFGETDEMVNKKMKFALENDFNTILSIGELDVEDSVEEIVSRFKKNIEGIDKSKFENLSVVYEPIWAIGTDEPDSPLRSEGVIIRLKKEANNIFGGESKKIRFLYGGSANSTNSKDFLEKENIDGLLIGRASLDAEEFSSIVNLSE
jgi:triosephosphate isomerase